MIMDCIENTRLSLQDAREKQSDETDRRVGGDPNSANPKLGHKSALLIGLLPDFLSGCESSTSSTMKGCNVSAITKTSVVLATKLWLLLTMGTISQQNCK